MAAITIIGKLEHVQYLPDCVYTHIAEFKKGFKKKDGTVVKDKWQSWKVRWKKEPFAKFISEHFATGMNVEVHGEATPFSVENGDTVAGYGVFGKTIDLFFYPKAASRMEYKAMRESSSGDDEQPDMESYEQSDF